MSKTKMRMDMTVIGSKKEISEFFKLCSIIMNAGSQQATSKVKLFVNGSNESDLHFCFENEKGELIPFPKPKDIDINKVIKTSIGE